MKRCRWHPALLLVAFGFTLCLAGCGGRQFYPVKGQVFVNGKPGEGVMVVFHPQNDPDPNPVRPYAHVQADGSFVLQSYVVDKQSLQQGVPAGKYEVTCVWYPPNLREFLGKSETLPDRLNGRYAVAATSGLSAEVPEKAVELPPFKLDTTR